MPLFLVFTAKLSVSGVVLKQLYQKTDGIRDVCTSELVSEYPIDTF